MVYNRVLYKGSQKSLTNYGLGIGQWSNYTIRFKVRWHGETWSMKKGYIQECKFIQKLLVAAMTIEQTTKTHKCFCRCRSSSCTWAQWGWCDDIAAIDALASLQVHLNSAPHLRRQQSICCQSKDPNCFEVFKRCGSHCFQLYEDHKVFLPEGAQPSRQPYKLGFFWRCRTQSKTGANATSSFSPML